MRGARPEPPPGVSTAGPAGESDRCTPVGSHPAEPEGIRLKPGRAGAPKVRPMRRVRGRTDGRIRKIARSRRPELRNRAHGLRLRSRDRGAGASGLKLRSRQPGAGALRVKLRSRKLRACAQGLKLRSRKLRTCARGLRLRGAERRALARKQSHIVHGCEQARKARGRVSAECKRARGRGNRVVPKLFGVARRAMQASRKSGFDAQDESHTLIHCPTCINHSVIRALRMTTLPAPAPPQTPASTPAP